MLTWLSASARRVAIDAGFELRRLFERGHGLVQAAEGGEDDAEVMARVRESRRVLDRLFEVGERGGGASALEELDPDVDDRFGQRRRDRERAPIGGDGVVAPPQRAQRDTMVVVGNRQIRLPGARFRERPTRAVPSGPTRRVTRPP